MKVTFDQLKGEIERVLLNLSFPQKKADICSTIFASNSLDGVYSHGLNRFPVFVNLVREGLIDPFAEPTKVEGTGNIEVWNGNRGPGMYNASLCMERAINLAKSSGIACVNIINNNHWMRGGTYGLQAVAAGCVGICFTNASAGMPAWGGTQPVLGNNPIVISVPYRDNPILLDMAMSQFSYGKLQEYQFRGESLPVPGGYDDAGRLTNDPAAIIKSKRALPIGYWKGSGLSLLLDILLTALGGGRSTADFAKDGKEVGLSQCFICIHRPDFHERLINEIINFTKNSGQSPDADGVSYPGENTQKRRLANVKDGIPVNEKIWQSVLSM